MTYPTFVVWNGRDGSPGESVLLLNGSCNLDENRLSVRMNPEKPFRMEIIAAHEMANLTAQDDR